MIYLNTLYDKSCENVRFTILNLHFLKHLFYIFLYLNIYIGFFCEINGQELYLFTESENETNKELLDSLNVQNKFKNYRSLKIEVDTLQYKLQRLGYIESELNSFQKINDSSYLAYFYFGKKFKRIKIFYSETDFSKKELLNVSSEISDDHFFLSYEQIEPALQFLTQLKSNEGNAFARVRLDNINKENDDSLIANLIFDRGEKRIIDHIVIKGYDKFPRSFLKYYAGIKNGKTFIQKEIVNRSELLNTLKFVKNIKPPEALFRKDSTTVYLYLKKQKNNLFDGVLGFSTNEETQRLIFNGYLNLELNNNLNYGERLTIDYKADGEEQQNFKVKVELPYLFRSPFGAGAELKIFKRDSTFVTTEQQLLINYQINLTTRIYTGFKNYESSNLLDEANTGSGVQDFNSKYLLSGLSFTRIQSNPIFPIKSQLSIDSEIGSRELKDEKESQIRISGTINHIFNLNHNNSIYLQNNTSMLTSDTYLTNELFRFGGINSIRGFNENSIDASLYSVLNTEYRYQFNAGIYIHSIIDVAYFENDVLQLKENLYSFGLGLGFQTRAGIFKFNIANGNSENQNISFDNTKIHISLSSRF